MTEDKELKGLLKEADKVWETLKKLPMYKNKSKEDYINYVKSSYYYYQSLSADEKKEFNRVKQEQFKKAIDALDNRKKEKENARHNNTKCTKTTN